MTQPNFRHLRCTSSTRGCLCYRQLTHFHVFFFFQAEDGIRDHCVTGVQTCALPIYCRLGIIQRHLEKFDFEVALDNAKATILTREADLAVKKAQNARRAILTTLSTSIEEKQVFEGNAKMAEAALASARAGLSQAEMNRQRTEVRAPVDGYVTSLLMRVGDFARAGTPN